ncbi:MAG: hypothetical protein WCQ32_00495 [bacterium]
MRFTDNVRVTTRCFEKLIPKNKERLLFDSIQASFLQTVGMRILPELKKIDHSDQKELSVEIHFSYAITVKILIFAVLEALELNPSAYFSEFQIEEV